MSKLDELLENLDSLDLASISGYIKVIFKDLETDKEQIKNDLISVIEKTCESFINEMLSYYPPDEYEYEMMPGCSFGKIEISNNEINIELLPYEMSVYGRNIPDILDLGSDTIKAIKEFLKDMDVLYEVVIISSQDFGVECSEWYNAYTNIKENPYADFINKVENMEFDD